MSRSILLVQPETPEGYSWERFLSANGFHVAIATTGRDGIRKTLETYPDLVLVDATLRDLPACEVGRQIKLNPRNRLVMVVLVTESSDLRENARAIEAGLDEVLCGSLSAQEKLERIQSWLHLKLEVSEEAESVVLAMARCIESKDPGTEGHCERLSAYATRFADLLGLPEEQRQALAIGGILHDLGKVSIPDSILFKAGPLTEAEFEIMKQHPATGEHICLPMKSFQNVLPIIRHHHERVDGSGYPDGLAGENIPITARILHIVDVYDALTTDRPYRSALSPDQAMLIVREEAARGWIDRQLLGPLEALTEKLQTDAQFIEFCLSTAFRHESLLQAALENSTDIVASFASEQSVVEGPNWRHVEDILRSLHGRNALLPAQA